MARVLEVDGVSKSFGQTLILKQVSFSVPEGVAVGLVGPNGAGKSTLLHVITGLIYPDEGSVRICGHDLVHRRVPALAHMGFISDTPFLYEHLTGREFLRLVGRIRCVEKVEATVDQLLDHFRLPKDARLLREYSLGMQKKVAIAAALLPHPTLLVMDEPFNAVDYAGTISLQNHIRELRADGTSILLATHLMDLVTACCSHVAFISDGRISEPQPLTDLLERYGRLESAFLAHVEEGSMC